MRLLALFGVMCGLVFGSGAAATDEETTDSTEWLQNSVYLIRANTARTTCEDEEQRAMQLLSERDDGRDWISILRYVQEMALRLPEEYRTDRDPPEQWKREHYAYFFMLNYQELIELIGENHVMRPYYPVWRIDEQPLVGNGTQPRIIDAMWRPGTDTREMIIWGQSDRIDLANQFYIQGHNEVQNAFDAAWEGRVDEATDHFKRAELNYLSGAATWEDLAMDIETELYLRDQLWNHFFTVFERLRFDESKTIGSTGNDDDDPELPSPS